MLSKEITIKQIFFHLVTIAILSLIMIHMLTTTRCSYVHTALDECVLAFQHILFQCCSSPQTMSCFFCHN